MQWDLWFSLKFTPTPPFSVFCHSQLNTFFFFIKQRHFGPLHVGFTFLLQRLPSNSKNSSNSWVTMTEHRRKPASVYREWTRFICFWSLCQALQRLSSYSLRKNKVLIASSLKHFLTSYQKLSPVFFKPHSWCNLSTSTPALSFVLVFVSSRIHVDGSCGQGLDCAWIQSFIDWPAVPLLTHR